MRVHLTSLGCRLNEAELESWAQAFRSAGDQLVANAREADIVVLNSCAVTHEAVRKSRQRIRRINRDNPDAKVVVSGCYATLNPEEAAQSMGVDLVVGNRDKAQLVERTKQRFSGGAVPPLTGESAGTALFRRGRQRAFVKVQDGCRYRCSFCIVTTARGEENSRSVQTVVSEINRLTEQGVQEAVLTGVHLGGYGSDRGTDLARLIRAVLDDTDIPRLRLGSLEPWDLPESFFRLFQNPRLMPHLHLPLQSGSDRVLRRMARRCKTQDYAKLVEQARSTVPDINITTDIIVGFPGETEPDWQSGLAFIERIGFGHVHIFPYSMRAGTKAARMPDQVPGAIKKQRSRQLHQRAGAMKYAFMQSYLGRTVPVLWEGQSPRREDRTVSSRFGYTPNYMRVEIRASDNTHLENRIRPVHLRSISDHGDHLVADCDEGDQDAALPLIR